MDHNTLKEKRQSLIDEIEVAKRLLKTNANQLKISSYIMPKGNLIEKITSFFHTAGSALQKD